jgi:photosystem II stability/assembly factor-like uncharacterized protein
MKTHLSITSKLLVPFILLNALLSGGSPALAQESEWQEYPLPDGISLFEFDFVDASIGWAAGEDNLAVQGVIYHTTDGGKTWSEQSRWPQSYYYFFDIAFRDARVGYAAGGKPSQTDPLPLIVRTADSGATWQAVTMPAEGGMIYDLELVPGGGLWAFGHDYARGNTEVIWFSTDGLTWSAHAFPPAQQYTIHKLAFPSAQTGYLIGETGAASPVPLVAKTSDGGQTWVELALPLTQGALFDAYFFNEQTGFVCGTSQDFGVILKTNDGGATWIETARLSGSKLVLHKITFGNPMTGFSYGSLEDGNDYSYPLYTSTDGGATWNRVQIPIDKIGGIGLPGDKIIIPTYDYDKKKGGFISKPMPPYTPPVTEPPPSQTQPPIQPPVQPPAEQPTLTSIQITPQNITLTVGQSQSFTATGYDQWGVVMDINDPRWALNGQSLPDCTGKSTCTITPTEAGNVKITASDKFVIVIDEELVRITANRSCGVVPLPPNYAFALLALTFGAVYLVQRKMAPPKG